MLRRGQGTIAGPKSGLGGSGPPTWAIQSSYIDVRTNDVISLSFGYSCRRDMRRRERYDGQNGREKDII